jgi:RNA polymerase-binding protein DksA
VEKKFLESMEKKLIAQKSSILSELISSNEDLREAYGNGEPGDLADIAGDDIERQLLEARGLAEVKKLKSIEAALIRIKQGRYGICVKCGKPIPKDRMEALPHTVMCFECKTADERRNH